MELRHPQGLAGSHPSYAVALAAIGHFLVREHARGLLVAELGTGFFVTWHDPAHWGRAYHRMVEHHEILDQTGAIQGALLMVEQARGPAKWRIFRKSQESLDLTLVDFFQALGKRLDRQRAVAITLIETNHGFRVTYWVDKATFVIHGRSRLPISLYHDETIERTEMKNTIEQEQILRDKDLHAIEHILRSSPRDYPALLGAVANLEEDLRYGAAEELAVQVASQLPDRDEARYHAARYAFARGDLAAAGERLRPALAAAAPAPEMLDLQARLLWAGGRRDEALRLWENATSADPPIPVHHQRYARALTQLGRFEEAARHAHVAEESTIAPTREMAMDILEAEAESPVEPMAPSTRRPTDHAMPLTASPEAGETGLHPFLTGDLAREEEFRGPLSTRLDSADWQERMPTLPPVPGPMPEIAAQPPSGRLVTGAGNGAPVDDTAAEAEIAGLRSLLDDNPQDPILLRKLGFALARKGQLDEAAEVYRKAREADSAP